MLVISFGETILESAYTISFDDYSDVRSIQTRLMCHDIQSEQNTVYTGKGIHGFAAMLFACLCKGTQVVALDAPTFIDVNNRDMYRDTREFVHSFFDEHQDILRFIEPCIKTRFIMNVPNSPLQEIHTQRMQIMRDAIVTDDYSSAVMIPIDFQAVSTSPIKIYKVVPFKHGQFNNYYHFWVDFMVPLIYFGQSCDQITVCNRENLVAKYAHKILPNVNLTYANHTDIIKGMNPKFVDWDDKTVQRIRELSSVIKNPEEVLFIKRPHNKRCILNDDEVFESLKVVFNNIKTVEPHTMHVSEQIQSFANAKIVIGQFGSGLTNCMFMNSGTTVIEIDTHYRRRYDVLCAHMNINHIHYEYTDNKEKTILDTKLFVDFLHLKGVS